MLLVVQQQRPSTPAHDASDIAAVLEDTFLAMSGRSIGVVLSGCVPMLASSWSYRPAGGHSAVLELGEANREWFSLAGFWSWIAWRSAYLTRLGERPAVGAMCCVPWAPLIIPSAACVCALMCKVNCK